MYLKKDFIKVLFQYLDPLRVKFSKGSAKIELAGAGTTYPKRVIDLESFSRPLWGLVPYWKGGGRDSFFEDTYRKGISSGTDPSSPEYWGMPVDNDQRFVEMAALAFGLLAVPEILWIPLSSDVKNNFAQWLNAINSHSLPKCNWLYFRVLVNYALKSIGMEYSRENLQSDLDEIESWYIGGGWYKDGVSGRRDYYCAFAMMYYPLLLNGLGVKGFQHIVERATEFAKDFKYWFSSDGAAIPYGRSLTYRFGQSAFWSASIFGGASVDIAEAKGIITRSIDYWMKKDIFNGDGSLSVGYGYPDLVFAERYNAPGSPYWALKTFLVLALPDDHPFWQEKEAPLCVDCTPHFISQADMIIQNDGWNATCYPLGLIRGKDLGHFTEKYGKFAYSTAFPFCVSHSIYSLEDACPDSMLSFISSDGLVHVRREMEESRISKDGIVCRWSPCTGIEVHTTIKPGISKTIRRHEIKTQVDVEFYESGFAVEDSSDTRIEEYKDGISASHSYGCLIRVLAGDLKPYLLKATPNSSLMYRNVVIPCLKGVLKKGDEVVIEVEVVTFREEEYEKI